MNLLIVESPAKAKTIEKYLGKGWKVIASVGHVRDLIPENGSVDPTAGFEMKWQIMPGKEKVIKSILNEVKKANAVYLASDPDREGEAIAWHLLEILNEKKALASKKLYRVVYHEITKKAIEAAIFAPRDINQNLVDAYLVRRALDYLIGFGISPLLWRRNLGKSAGRVQSVAVRLVVDREREIEAFKATEYWSLDAECKSEKRKEEGGNFIAHLTKFRDKKIEKTTIGNKAEMDEVLSAFHTPFSASVSMVEKKKTQRKPAAPFTTSTLQQEAARKLHFSSKRTMSIAQKLYEQGFITYMRTDAVNLSVDSVSEIRDYIATNYGENYLPAAPIAYANKSKNAQEAHEAVRPTHFGLQLSLDGDESKLYDLIWKRTIACQMTNAEFDSVAVDIETKNAFFHATGQTQTFAGFLKVYKEDRDEEPDEDTDVKLPPLAVGDKIEITKLLPNQHFTQPPARYTEATLVKRLEELGIGRPSTYATIMSTIIDRGYVEQDRSRRFFASPAGWVITAYLSAYFHDLIDVNFTAKTEDTLDNVANGEQKKEPALNAFWQPTEKLINSARDIKTAEIIDNLNNNMLEHIEKIAGKKCPKCGGNIIMKLGKYGPFVSCKNYPRCDFIQRLETVGQKPEKTGEHGDKKTTIGALVDLGEGIVFKIGRFGPYVSDGTKNASAKKFTIETISLEQAKKLLEAVEKNAEAISLGINPVTGKDILFHARGRFGPYISNNNINVSVKEQPSLNEAVELINNKKPSKWKKK